MEQSGAGMAVVVGVATNGDSVMMAPSRFCESPSCLVSPQDELTPIVFLLLLEARPTDRRGGGIVSVATSFVCCPLFLPILSSLFLFVLLSSPKAFFSLLNGFLVLSEFLLGWRSFSPDLWVNFRL